MAGNSNSGRIKDEVRHKFQRIIEQSKADEKFGKILSYTKKQDVFLKAYDMAHDRAYGKPNQSVDMKTEDVTPRPSLSDLDAAIESFGNSTNGKRMEKAK